MNDDASPSRGIHKEVEMQGRSSPSRGRTDQAVPVLVVDDDEATLQIVSIVLRDEGYHVLTARDAPEALAALDEQAPACVVLDLQLPVVDGRAIAEAVRARDPSIPIILMTATIDPQHWAAEIGAAALLAKPFDLRDLLETVTRVRTDASSSPLIGEQVASSRDPA